MLQSTVHVQYGDGSAARGVEVKLGFGWGNTDPGFTDDDGDVVLSHSSPGNATVYVSGRSVGSFTAPGHTAVTIR